MKIVVSQDFLRSGGTERQSILLANGFAAAGHETTLLTFRPGGALAATVSARVRHRALQPFDFHLDWFAPGMLRETLQLAPDIILSMGRMANGYAGLLQREVPTATVVATMRTGRELPAMFVRSLAVVRHIVANSHAAQDTLVRRYAVPPEKISVIYNGLVFPAMSPDTGATTARDGLRARFGASSATTVLLCVAMFRPGKNQADLIETLAELPRDFDWQLWFAGDGATRRECEKRAEELRLGARIKFIGFHSDPSALYAAADIAVHASRTEALSNFVIEAQSHGLPAVVYEAQGMEECFIPKQTGWVIPRASSDAFRSAILRLSRESADDRAKRSAAARQFARDRFAPNRQTQAYLDLFSQLSRRTTALAPRRSVS